MPSQINPAEFILDLTNVDFDSDVQACQEIITQIQNSWASSSAALAETSRRRMSLGGGSFIGSENEVFGRRIMATIRILLHQPWINSRRDAVVYGVCFAMYLGLAIMMGTVRLRLPPVKSSIQPFASCILFGSSFMSFMAVVYVPAFLEDRAVYIKDRANGLYGKYGIHHLKLSDWTTVPTYNRIRVVYLRLLDDQLPSYEHCIHNLGYVDVS